MVALVVIAGVAAALFYFENRGLPGSGWEAWAGSDGPETTSILDGTDGIAADFNVTREEVVGDSELFGRYLDEIPGSSKISLRFKTDANTTIDIELGSTESVSCTTDTASNRTAEFSAGRYRIDSGRGKCDITLEVNRTLEDHRDGAPLEWNADLRGPPTWWFSFEAGKRSDSARTFQTPDTVSGGPPYLRSRAR